MFAALARTSRRSFSSVAIYQTSTVDPFLNLAWEETLLAAHPRDKHSLFLWRNSPSVIIGRFQNPHKEVATFFFDFFLLSTFPQTQSL